MALYYFKGQPIVTPFTIASNQPAWDLDSVSLSKHRTGQDAQRWELSFTVQTSSDISTLLIDTVQDFDTVKTMIMPQLLEVDRRVTATGGNVSASAELGATSVTVANLGGLLPKGSFIKFSNHGKIYMTRNDVTNAGSLQIYPKLRSSIVYNAEALVTINHPGLLSAGKPVLSYVQDIDNTRGIIFSDGILVEQGTITVIEAV